jgi:hypothetical protein
MKKKPCLWRTSKFHLEGFSKQPTTGFLKA